MTIDSSNKMMTTRRGLGYVEETTDKAAQNPIVHDIPRDTRVASKIQKSPQMPRPKKDTQATGPVRMSPWNPQFGKLSMEEKGKAITIETNNEEEDLQALADEIEAAKDVTQ